MVSLAHQVAIRRNRLATQIKATETGLARLQARLDNYKGELADLPPVRSGEDLTWRVRDPSGNKYRTLQEAGDKYGVSRERVRQLCARPGSGWSYLGHEPAGRKGRPWRPAAESAEVA